MNILIALIAFQPLQVEETILDNGLKVLIYEDHFAPVVSVQVHYRVGAYNEVLGITGISHLLEHMAFKGTTKIGPKEYNKIIERAGGEENAFTSTHRTVYFANLSEDRYEIELELEADRMQNLTLAQKEFEPEKGVVMEERRLGENDPYSSFFEQLDFVSYSYHPYRRPVIGFMSDLEKISRDDVYNYYRKFYNPANAVVIVAGSVDPVDALKKVKKHFGKIPGRKVEEPVYAEPPQHGERRFILKREVHLPALAIQYHTVPANNRSKYALDLISMILSNGMSSRFQMKIVREKGVAVEANVYSSNTKYGGSFTVFAIPQVGVDIETLEREVLNELDMLKSVYVTDDELTKAKNQLIARTVYRLDSSSWMGFTIGWWEIEGGGWRNFNFYLDEINNIDKEAILSTAKEFFTEDNRTVGYLLPKEEK
ncbi:hypothetical protein A2Y85_08155 [candidate division WOR-3 bacterium RBG_13_43_14]|uniref:Peptidase M16 n=1 Tax=candidate division WOR-3 bacterium RBG_13_43_14 TaxID=1802590 RepID=A0A1F4U6V6_UNCW3|nr:MAG: hypothetical protein A2Y85_08155 [candidate division WOR-3 bacterium RBG_13_43_14]